MSYPEDFAEELRKGTNFELWIANPSVDLCPVNKANLGLNDLDDEEWTIELNTIGLPNGYSPNKMQVLDLPAYQYHDIQLRRNGYGYGDIRWSGRLAKGVIFVEDVCRDQGVIGPYISDLSIAAYREWYEPVSLKNIFVTNIVNVKTKRLLTRLCPPSLVSICEPGTLGYRALLGTPIGKMVASTVLGIFERGTVRIARIVVWWTGEFRGMGHVRFDIERI